MTYAIIYANRDRGYGCYERSRGFPEKYEHMVDRISGFIGQSANTESERVDLRYSPLEDSYLLSVIFRVRNGNADECRPHNIIVHFLMDAETADEFFQMPFSAAADNAKKLAAAMLEQCSGKELPEGLDRYLLSGSGVALKTVKRKIYPAVALAGALYSRGKSPFCQLFAELTSDPIAEVQALLQDLPPRLRKLISFHTGVLSPGESRGVTLCISPAPKLRNMISNDFEGAERSNKYYCFPENANDGSNLDQRAVTKAGLLVKLPDRIPLYGLLQEAIWTWDEYFRLIEAFKQKNPLSAALGILPDERVAALLDDGGALDSEVLMLLERSAPKRSEVSRKARWLLRLREPEQQPREIPQSNPEETADENGKRRESNRSDKNARGLSFQLECVLCLLGLILLTLAVVFSVRFVLLDMAGVEAITASMDTMLDLISILGIIVGTLFVGVFGRGILEKIRDK